MRKVFDFFLFSSIYISCCAVLMAHQVNQLLHLDYTHGNYLAFVFFATLSSYNFHWLLTPDSVPEKQRTAWTQRNRSLHILFLGVGLAGTCWWGFSFINYWWEMGIAAGLTFLYSAPKIPHKFFSWLKKIAIGKTIFLAFVWTYVTAILPVLISKEPITNLSVLFFLSRFFLIYTVCIPFDYRDKDFDKQEGIRSIVTWFSEKGIDRLFYFSLAMFVLFTYLCYQNGMPINIFLVLLTPVLILPLLYRWAKHNFSDYLYDFALDGMMAFTSLISLFIRI